MNRLYLGLIAVFLFLFFQNNRVKQFVIDTSNKIKEEIVYLSDNIHQKINFFKNQQKKIEFLTNENKKLQQNLLKFEAIFSKCKDLSYFNKINKPNLYFVETISYAALPDFTKIYINYPKTFIKAKGLIYNNLAAGIVVKNYGKTSLALLNSNSKTSYAVIIGKNEVPGIFFGKDYVVKYIKKYIPIKVGDIVKTSGLDGIFYKGALVGEVKEVIETKLYQEVKVKMFYNKLTPDFFYVVEKNDTIK